MSEAYLKKIFNLTNIAWQSYKKWSQTSIDMRNDSYWDKVTHEIKELVKQHADNETKQFFTDTLNAYTGQLDREASKQYKQERLKL